MEEPVYDFNNYINQLHETILCTAGGDSFIVKRVNQDGSPTHVVLFNATISFSQSRSYKNHYPKILKFGSSFPHLIELVFAWMIPQVVILDQSSDLKLPAGGRYVYCPKKREEHYNYNVNPIVSITTGDAI